MEDQKKKSIDVTMELQHCAELTFLSQIYKMPEEYLEEIEKMRNMKNPIILFGAGSTREFNLNYFRNLGIMPVAFCDNSIEKIGKYVDDIKILSFEEVRKQYPNAYFYITTQLYFCEIRLLLLANGYEEEQISEYDIIFQLQWEKDCMQYYRQHEEEIELLYKELADEESRNVLRNRMAFLRTRKRSYMLGVRQKEQYFDKKLINFSDICCFVDLGLYIGDTVLEFLKLSGNRHCLIYGFEPDMDLYKIAEANLKTYDKVILVPKAVSDCDGEITAEESLGVMQTIEADVFVSKKEFKKTFSLCKLDTYFESFSGQIDMIKMDIEGAELSALHGAKNRIIQDKPYLAVCVYHKVEDIIEIPAFCRKLVPSYQIYLRHYSDNQTETVCYFIPKKAEEVVGDGNE